VKQKVARRRKIDQTSPYLPSSENNMRSVIPICLAIGALLLSKPLTAQDVQSRLWDAAMSGDTAVLRQAAAEGARVDSLDTRRNMNGRRALNWAALYNRVPAISVLLSLGAPIEATNLTGFTALHHAAEAGSLEAARALLAAGADPTRANNDGRTPVETARGLGHESVAALLEAAIREKAAKPQ
jgi:ankyrin repeat protein